MLMPVSVWLIHLLCDWYFERAFTSKAACRDLYAAFLGEYHDFRRPTTRKANTHQDRDMV